MIFSSKLQKILNKKLFVFFKKKIVYSAPKNRNVLILDSLSGERLIKLIDHKYSVLIVDLQNVIYIKYIIRSFFFNNVVKFPNLNKLAVNYYIEIIRDVSPKLILTTIDNAPIFWNVDFIVSKKIKFLTIQNGTHLLGISKGVVPRYRERFLDYPPFYSNLACISQFDYDHYIKFGGIVEKHYKVGGVFISSFISSYKEKEKLYDICIIANRRNDGPGEKRMLDYVMKYISSHDVSVCVALKWGNKSSWFNDNLSEFSECIKCQKIKIIERCGYSSHYASDTSEVTIAHGTTLLRQSYSRGNKIYPMNFIDNSMSPPFDILGYSLSPEYSEFEKHLDYLLAVDRMTYIKENKRHMEYIDTFDINYNPEKKVKNIIKDFLETN